MVQKFNPSKNSHCKLIMEHSENVGCKISVSDKEPNSKPDFNFSDTPYFIQTENSCYNGSCNTESKKVDESTQQVPEEDDLFISFRSFLIFGKLIGVLPYSGIFGKSSNNLSYKKLSPTSIVTHIIAAIVFMNCVFGTISSIKASKRNALEIAESVRSTLYFVWGFLIFLIFIVRGDQFLEIFHSWKKTRVIYSKKDTTLKRDMVLIAGVIFVSAVLENAVLHLEYIKDMDNFSVGLQRKYGKNMTTLEAYYWRSHEHWAMHIGYNWFVAILAFVQHKWILYAWNFMDVLVALFGRAMYFRFKCLFETAEMKLIGSPEIRLDNLRSKVCEDNSAWLQVVFDHQRLCRLLEIIENFFSPVIFASYAINTFYICLQLMDGLTNEDSKHSIVHSIYAPWSFLHLIMRTFIISVCCALIHVYAHKTRLLLQECPIQYYDAEISRTDKLITSGPPIALSGLGTFYVTPPFMLNILYVVFTFEIVLLQCIPNTAANAALHSKC